jgi:hypothetical protein
MQAIEALEATGFEVVKPFVAELLEWLQDSHWPVATPIAAYLQPYLSELTADVLVILRSADALWKSATITLLLDVEERPPLNTAVEAELLRIIAAPTYSEWEESVDDAALYLLEGFDSETATELLFFFEWVGTAERGQINAFWELFEMALLDYDVLHIVKKNDKKGKIRKSDSPVDFHSLRGLLIKIIDQIGEVLPNILSKMETRFSL